MCGQDGKAGAVDVPVRVGVCDGDCSQAEKEWVQVSLEELWLLYRSSSIILYTITSIAFNH